MNELYYATGNSDKFDAVNRYLEKNLPHIVLKPCVQDFPEIQSYDQRAVAVDKARQAWDYLQKPVLVDDAGIYFEKYRDFPGVLTKFVYRGIGIEGLCKLTEPGDKATFRLSMVYYYGPETYEVFVGECPGHIIHQEHFVTGEYSPYDQIFAPEGRKETFAELLQSGQAEQYHYRIHALKKFLHWYTQQSF